MGGIAQYFGEFARNLFNGKGEILWSNGDRFNGDFKDGLYNGKGIYKFNMNTCVYTGEFSKGKFNGRGELCKRGDYTVVGLFKDGALDTSLEAEIHFSNGDLYKGEMLFMRMEGRGEYWH